MFEIISILKSNHKYLILYCHLGQASCLFEGKGSQEKVEEFFWGQCRGKMLEVLAKNLNHFEFKTYRNGFFTSASGSPKVSLSIARSGKMKNLTV